MNYAMGEDGDNAIGASAPFLPAWLLTALGGFLVAVIALVFGYVVLLAVAETFKLGPYSPAGIARAKARRLENVAEAKRRGALASAEARRHEADAELLRRAMDRIERDV